jgi:hypothetical protein
LLAAGLAVAVTAGLLFVTAALAQPAPPSPQQRGPMCQGVLPSQADPILAKYRERAQTARDNVMKEDRALFALLIAENTTRAAVDAQTTKANDARSALARVRLDMLWDLRAVIPAQNREQVFRCAEFTLLRRR